MRRWRWQIQHETIWTASGDAIKFLSSLFLLLLLSVSSNNVVFIFNTAYTAILDYHNGIPFQLWIITQFGIRTKWKWQQFILIDTALCTISAEEFLLDFSPFLPFILLKFIHLLQLSVNGRRWRSYKIIFQFAAANSTHCFFLTCLFFCWYNFWHLDEIQFGNSSHVADLIGY